ncbi:MAG: hypothetical protein ACJARN_002319, partial [Arenicella sp.]
ALKSTLARPILTRPKSLVFNFAQFLSIAQPTSLLISCPDKLAQSKGKVNSK